jgi:hypothetical protein
VVRIKKKTSDNERSTTMLVKTQQVKQICEILLTYLEQSGCHEIELERDAYWTVISREDLYANDGSPQLGVGSLNDDKEALEKILDGTHPISTNDFERLGNIFIAITEKLDQL